MLAAAYTTAHSFFSAHYLRDETAAIIRVGYEVSMAAVIRTDDIAVTFQCADNACSNSLLTNTGVDGSAQDACIEQPEQFMLYCIDGQHCFEEF